MNAKKFFSYKITQKCAGCMACAEDCPVRAVDGSKFPPRINQNLCIGCGDCYEICPAGAIDRKFFYERSAEEMENKIKRAIISVSNKIGAVDLAKSLSKSGVEIISTGGTMKAIRAMGIPVTYVSDLTGFPEIMDGRVKTLNPKIHGGILAVRDNPNHLKQMDENDIKPIDLVVVNLYPFKATIKKENATLDDAIENIDIGGPAMIRAAAKNFKFVTVVTDPSRYEEIAKMIAEKGFVDYELRKKLAAEAFAHTADYDLMIAEYLS